MLALSLLIALPAAARDYDSVLWDESHGAYSSYTLTRSFSQLADALDSAGFAAETNDAAISSLDLSDVGVLVVSVISAYDDEYSSTEAELIEEFVYDGGNLLIMCDNSGAWPDHINPVSEAFGVSCGLASSSDEIDSFDDHDILDGVSEIGNAASGTLTADDPSEIVAWRSGDGAVAVAEHGAGRVVVIDDANTFDNSRLAYYDNGLFADNIFVWLSWDHGYDSTDRDRDGVDDDDDCEPDDGDIYPGAEEICDGIDNDCDGAIDTDDDDISDDDTAEWYPDNDGDGFGGVGGTPVVQCEMPDAHSLLDTDCDDADADVYPDAQETCDGIDNDCDDLIDDDDDSLSDSEGDTWYFDSDGDGYGGTTSVSACDVPDDYVATGGDCDDRDYDAYPGAAEICDRIDNDCDDLVDDADDDVEVSATDIYYADTDGDGFGDPSVSEARCEGDRDWIVDNTDCDDMDYDVYPGAREVCDDLDNDCDGLKDDDDDDLDDPDMERFYADSDEDGFGDAEVWTDACDPPEGYVDDDTDCLDSDGAVNPDGQEVCNGLDDDCDSLTDDDDDSLDLDTTSTWYADVDGDGFGDDDISTDSCDPPEFYTDVAGDCDDSQAAILPGAEEVCDDLDNDCNSIVDDNAVDAPTWYLDEDGDGHAGDSTTVSCEPPPYGLEASTDCNDDDHTISPAAEEICDDVDNDCDGSADEGLDCAEDEIDDDKDAGCSGCASGGNLAGLWVLPLMVLGAARRRR